MQRGSAWRTQAAFAFLCLVAASRWIFSEAWPQSVSTLRSEAWACGLLAVIFAAAAVVHRRPLPGLRSSVQIVVLGACLLAMPAIGAAFHNAAADSLNRTVAFCLVPVIVAFFGGIMSAEIESAPRLWPGLAGLGGALLIFPLFIPSSPWAYAGLVLPAIALGAAVACLRRAACTLSAAWSAALLLGGGGGCLALLELALRTTGGSPRSTVSMGAVGLDILLAWLTIHVVLRLEPLQYASQYFIVPLLTIGEGVLLRVSGMSLRLAGAGLLLAVAAAVLWRAPVAKPGTSTLQLR